MNVDKYLNSDGSAPEWLSEFKRCQQWIEDALEYNGGTHTIEDVLHAVATNEMQLWSADNSVIVGQIVQFPRKKAYHLPFVGGNLAEIESMGPSIRAFAKFLGCDWITSAGRRGWDRTFLRKEGFTPLYYVSKTEV
mgnify:CR=1 FL=1